MKKGYKNNICLSTNATPKGIICLVWDLYSSEYRLHRLGVGSARAIFKLMPDLLSCSNIS